MYIRLLLVLALDFLIICSSSIVLEGAEENILFYNALPWGSSESVSNSYIVDILADKNVFDYCDLDKYTRDGAAPLLSHHKVKIIKR